MADLTDEQREAALEAMAESMAGLGWDGNAWMNEAACALDALIAQGWGPVAEVRIRAEKEIAENADAIAAARAEYGQDDKTFVPGILAMLRREVLRRADWNAAEEEWIGALECLAQADAYAYAEREIRERELDGLAEARGYRAGLEAALTARIQMADAEDGPEPTIERIVRLYYTGRISEWDLANSYADQFLAAIRALTPEKPKEAEDGELIPSEVRPSALSAAVKAIADMHKKDPSE